MANFARRQVWLPSSPLRALTAKLPSSKVTYVSGDDLAAAASAAKSADIAIVFGYQPESEGMDLKSLDLSDDQNKLIEAVAAANAKTIVVLETGSPTTMPWASAADSSGVYVSGDFDDYSSFGDRLIAAPEYAPSYLGANYFTQPFVAKFDRNGNPLWALNGLSPLLANFRGVATASDGVWASGIVQIFDALQYAQFGTNSVASDGYLYYYGTGVTFFFTQGGLLTKITESPVASPVTLLNPRRVGTNVQFSFQAAANILYTIQTSTNLASGSWSVFGAVTGSNTTQTISAPIPSNSRALFFRVISF